MKDIREHIFNVAFRKPNGGALDAMDDYAIHILQWIFDNKQDLTCVGEFNAKEYLEEIKKELNTPYWYDPKAQELFSDFEKKKQEQFKKDCQSGKL